MSEHAKPEAHGAPPTLLEDIRLIFATILTDPGSSLAYGADALLAITTILLQRNYESGMIATFVGGGIVMGVYLIAILVYNSMTRHHVHRILGGGAFVSSHITSQQIRTPWLKRVVQLMGKTGTASLLADFPATQAISLIAGVEALYFIPIEERLPEEVAGWQTTRTAPRDVKVYNPAFDVTPAKYITAIICEEGVLHPPFEESLGKLKR